jgi:hypothetical protein
LLFSAGKTNYDFMTAMLQKSPIGVLGTACPSNFSKSATARFTPGKSG